MRGGTSKALFFRREELPADPELRDRVILAAYGSPDPFRRQLDGIGGATSSTSKVAVVGPSGGPGTDIDYLFGQVGIDAPLIDWGGNCGNISAAVGPFAIEEGWVPPGQPITPVRIFNVNTQKVILAHVPVADGTFLAEGDFAIQGVPGMGAKILLEYLDPGGSVTSRTLPTGHARDRFSVPGLGQVEVSVIDAANPLVVCRAEALGLSGIESPAAMDADGVLMARLEALRGQAAAACGLARTPEEAAERSPAIPKVAVVAPARSFRATDGTMVDASEVDLVGRVVSMGRVHSSFALTSAIGTAVGALLPGTVIYEVVAAGTGRGPSPLLTKEGRGGGHTGWVRLGHPAGAMEALGVTVEPVAGEWHVVKVSSNRTARRLMDGGVYVPASLFPATIRAATVRERSPAVPRP